MSINGRASDVSKECHKRCHETSAEYLGMRCQKRQQRMTAAECVKENMFTEGVEIVSAESVSKMSLLDTV